MNMIERKAPAKAPALRGTVNMTHGGGRPEVVMPKLPNLQDMPQPVPLTIRSFDDQEFRKRLEKMQERLEKAQERMQAAQQRMQQAQEKMEGQLKKLEEAQRQQQSEPPQPPSANEVQ